MSFRYSCYGLVLLSEIELPDLGAPLEGDAPPDVVIRYGDLGDPAPATVTESGLWREGDVCGIEVPDVGRYQARAGTEIVVDPVAGADPRAVRLFLLGSAMGATMMLRGCLVLHGNAIRIGHGTDEGCAIVLGHSGSGKSTLAAEFHRRGYDVLSDDVVPVDAEGRALPGYPRIKLWDDALGRLGRDTDGLERIHDDHEKFHVPLDRAALTPLPVRRLYVLERHAGPTLQVERAHGALTFELLHEHTYRNELISGPEAVAEHLQQCARLVDRARLRRVLRPAETMTAEATADAILADLNPGANPDVNPDVTPDVSLHQETS